MMRWSCPVSLFLSVAAVVGCSSNDAGPSPGTAGNAPQAGNSNAGQGGTAGVGGASRGGSSGIAGSAGSAGENGSAGSMSGGGQGGAGGAGGALNVLPPLGPAPIDKPGTIEVGIRNNCPFPIWIRASGSQVPLLPDNRRFLKGEFYWYDAPQEWASARVTAFADEGNKEELDKVEMTFDSRQDTLNYNITYVDFVGLPMEMISRGRGEQCQRVGCYATEASILSGCPDGLLDGKKCLAARTYCFNGRNDDKPYCHALDQEIARCASTKPGCQGAAGHKTANVYACDGFFGQTPSDPRLAPRWCAAINRGMLDDPESIDTSKYYRTPPYNTYSKWVHEVCPGIYAFAYDDYPPNPNESGYRSCLGGKELEITFCPAG